MGDWQGEPSSLAQCSRREANCPRASIGAADQKIIAYHGPMIRLHLLIVVLLLALTSGCSELGDRSSSDDDSFDDDDSANGGTSDDDDATSKPDDDDSVGDDDDSAGDDDDSAGDDDDSVSVDPGLAFVQRSYCLNWDSVNFQSPPGFVDILGGYGINLADYPLLLSPTAVSILVEEILMVLAATQLGTCSQDTSLSTYNLTVSEAGRYVAPHFEVGPSDINVGTQLGTLNLYDTVFAGDFTGDAEQVVQGSITGQLDISAYSSFLCSSSLGWTCAPCPTGVGTCVDLVATDAIWDHNNEGPLLVVP